MKAAFYCRTSSGSFACILPDEKQKLHNFFAAEHRKEAEKSRKTERPAPCRKK